MATNKLLDIEGLKEFKTKQDAANAAKYAPLPVTSDALADGCVTADKLDTDVTDLFLTEVPIATASVVGGVKIGSNISITSDGTISVATPETYTLPIATTSVLGGVKASSRVTISSAGVLDIGTGTITTTQIADGGVATADLADSCVTLAKIAQAAVATTAEIDNLFTTSTTA